MANDDRMSGAEIRGGSKGVGKLWGMVGVLVMIFILSRVGVPWSLVKNFIPLGARQGFANTCDECGGDGKTETRCKKCFGRGYYQGANCTECNKTGKVEQTCSFCGGSGKKPKP